MRKSKLVMMILALVLVLALVAACGRGGDDNGDENGNGNGNGTEVVEGNGNGNGDDPGDDNAGDPPVVVEPDPVPARAPGLVYSFTTDEYLQAADIGASGDIGIAGGSPYLDQAGSPTFTIIGGVNVYGDLRAISVTGRQNHWDSLDIDTTAFDWDPDNNQYQIVVSGSLGGAGTIRLNGANSPYTVFDSRVLDDAGVFMLGAILDRAAIDAMGDRQWLRVQTYPELVDINIYNIYVVQHIARPENVIYSLSTDPLIQAHNVDDQGASGLLGYAQNEVLALAGDPVMRIIETPFGHNGVQVRNRMNSWCALDLQLRHLPLDLANNTYLVTLIGNHAHDGAEARIEGADSPWSWFETVGTDGDFEVSLVLDAEIFAGAGVRNWLRLNSSPLEHFNIYEITVVRQ